MISLIHTHVNESTPFGSLKINFDNPMDLEIIKNPIVFKVQSLVSGKILWETELHPGCWSYYGSISNTISQIIRKEKILAEFIWDPFLHGDIANQYMSLWALENQGSLGLAIGTHNGETGEWVDPILKGKLSGLLVEASDSQFSELVSNYQDLENCQTLKALITPDQGEFTFWESKNHSYANSLNRSHVEEISGESVIGKNMKSVSLNSLIENQEKKVKWIHLDTERIDIDLILSLSEENISNVEIIVYETLNSSVEEKSVCERFLKSHGFSIQESGWNTIAIKK
jgi:FkbM family methyltransferase